MEFNHEELVKQIIENSGDISYLVKPFSLVEIDSSKKRVKDCGERCYFNVPPSTGKTNGVYHFYRREGDIEHLEKDRLDSEIFGSDFSDRIHLALNTNMIRVYEIDDKEVVTAACVMLSKNGKCMDERKFKFCDKNPISDKLLYKFQK